MGYAATSASGRGLPAVVLEGMERRLPYSYGVHFMTRCTVSGSDCDVSSNGERGLLVYYKSAIWYASEKSHMRVKNFLKPDRHNHKDPQVRIERLRALDPHSPEDQRILAELAMHDDDVAVRNAAIGLVTDIAVLSRFLDGEDDTGGAAQSAAESRIATLFASGLVSDGEASRLLSTQANRYRTLIAEHSTVVEQRQQAMDRIFEESDFVHVVQHARFHDTRLQAAQKLTQHDTMRVALTACRVRDKLVAKLLQSRLDAQSAAEAELIASKHAVNAVVSSMQSLTNCVWSPQTAGRLQALQSRWSTLDDKNKLTFVSEFNQASEHVQMLIDEHNTTRDVLANDQPSSSSSAEPTLSSEDQSVSETANTQRETETVKLDAVAMAFQKELAQASLGGLPLVIGKLGDEARPVGTGVAAVAVAESKNNGIASILLAHASSVAVLFDPPYDLAKARPEGIAQRLKRVEVLLDTNNILPGVDMTENVYLTELSEHRGQLLARLDKARQESSDRVKATHRQFSALSSILSDGKWGPATSMHRRLKKKLAAMEPAERSKFTDKIARAEKQLGDMADWQDFAARPKLEVICDEMEALPSKSMEPEKLAKEVKSLQAQWKSLGISRASNELWTRFKTAGDTAYEPCKEYFNAKQCERKERLDRKILICNSLKEKFDNFTWTTADWKDIQRTVSNAKREWSNNRIVDRKPDKTLEQKFSDVLRPIESKIKEQYEANIEIKQELVDKIQKLSEAEINQHTANQAKSLLSAWKQVGIMRRKDDQLLWEKFNTHSRTIFKHQKNTEREKYQASMGHVFRAKDIIKTLRKCARDSATDQSQVHELVTEFQALAEFPDKEKKYILRDFRTAVDACSKLQETQSKRRVRGEHDELLRKATLCEQLEKAVEAAEFSNATLLDDVMHAWNSSDVSLSREIESRIGKRRDAALKHLQSSTKYNYGETESLRRDLLIRMEVSAEIDTPAEDKSRRMQYQLAHLQEGMISHGLSDKSTELADMELEWFGSPPVLQSLHSAFYSRYLKAIGR